MPGTVRVHVPNDDLSVRLDCVIEPGGEEEAVSEALAQCEQLGIKPALTVDDIKAVLIPALEKGTRVINLVLAAGQAPVPPTEGEIAWERDFFSSPLVEDPETGRIDFRQRLDNGIVVEGNRLAVLIPPQPGTPGVDVFGRAIPVAKPPKLRIRAGIGVQFDEATNTLTATVVGRVRFAKGVLSVDQTYAIPGSVGLKTGNVKHPGAVDIGRDVEPDSRVEADGGVHISGALEESVVTAGGDVLVGHGIIGGDRAKVHAGGSIEAAFAERAELEAGHDIRIRRELIQCTARANGTVQIPEGQIIGGTVNALGGIDVGQAGSHGDVRTVLVTGVDPALQEMLAARHAAARACHDRIVQLNERIAPFKARQSTLTPMLHKKMDEFLAELQDVEAERDRVQREIEVLTEESRERAKAEIYIRRRVYPDTHLCIGHAKLIVTIQQEGPLVARLDENGEVALQAENQP